MLESHAHQSKFQTFWQGGVLSPYELVCLKSFTDRGYAVDLYSYDQSLIVPDGVRLCGAGELFDRGEFFVYSPEGFGHGSPSAFTNLFRYKLLAENGGWWIDTDVLCHAERIVAHGEFFARQDTDFINGAVLYFEPGHPVMVRCMQEAATLGRAIKWGDAGPRLLTRVLQDQGASDRALPASTCYPIHYSDALDMLRPSRSAALAPAVEGSPFIHLWHSMLTHGGVDKWLLPPKGSLLRQWVDRHPVEGWNGEYDERSLEQALRARAALNAGPRGPSVAPVAFAHRIGRVTLRVLRRLLRGGNA